MDRPRRGRPGAALAGFASPLFERVWTRTDQPVAAGVTSRSWTWGPGAGPTVQEPWAGGTRNVQYFDKARMEVNSAVSDPNSPWAATSGLLVVELVGGRMQAGPDQFESRAPADIPVAGEQPAPGDRAVPTYASFAAVASLPGGPDRRAPFVRGKAVTTTISRDGVGSIARRSQPRRQLCRLQPGDRAQHPRCVLELHVRPGLCRRRGWLPAAPAF